MNIKNLFFLIAIIAVLTSWHCAAIKKTNLFSIQDDKNLGLQVSGEIENAPGQYPLLPERGNEEVYRYIRNMTNTILNSGNVKHGVMGHEIAHADLRHSTRQMTSSYGVSTLLTMATGNANDGMVKQVLSGLTSLKFSRNHENEADANSVEYLCNTKYDPAGAAGFFKKIAGSEAPPQFLSTHPNSDDRVKNIETRAASKTCSPSTTTVTQHNRIKQLIK